MIAEVANALGDPEAEHPLPSSRREPVPEKPLLTCRCLPIARQRGKKVVVASATIALQEQLLFRDLPDVMRNSGLDMRQPWPRGGVVIFAF